MGIDVSDAIRIIEESRLAVCKHRANTCLHTCPCTCLSTCQVALMFLNKGERNALHKYLVEKIRVLPRSEHTQLTVCTTWVVEIFLKKLSLIKDQSDKSQAQYKQIINSFQVPSEL